MCGFVGFAGSEPPFDMRQGAEWIRRRGPDSMGIWSASGGHVHLHHARLSISDLRPAAAQPMSEPASGLTIAFVGEIYNHLALRQTIAQPFRTDSDTETLLRVFERHGTAALPLLRGMFAIVLFDERKRRILLIRDPVGKKPLFLLQRPEGSYFGSSILALVAASGHNEIDAEVANRWWELGFSPPGMSLLAGCRPLKPGEVVELDWDGRVLSSERITPPEPQSIRGITFQDAVDELEARVRTAVKRRLNDNPNPVALLSGGIDSTVVCKFAAELGATRLLLVETGPLKTSDSKYARIAAERLGTALEVVPQHFSSVRTAVETAVDLQDEPLAIISFVALANVAAEACVGSRVLLTGDGGDEVFGGYGSPDDWIAEEPVRSGSFQSGPAYPNWMSEYGRHAAGFDLVGHNFAKLDRATAEQALEARCPLIDWDVQAFVRSLPQEVFFPDARSKPLAKALLRDWPQSFLERKKAGFPFRLRLLWGLWRYVGLREAVWSESLSRFNGKMPSGLRKPPQQWSNVDIARNFTFAFKLYVWSAFLAKLHSIKSTGRLFEAAPMSAVIAFNKPRESLSDRINYVLWSTARRLIDRNQACPSCGSTEHSRVDRKYGVTTLERCHHCQLLFRLPRGDELKPCLNGHSFAGMTEDLPERGVLEHLKRQAFKGSEKDASRTLELLSALGCEPGSTRIIDYGCSWGYTTWQLQNAGYRATGFEPNRTRCEYAVTRMGVMAFHSEHRLSGRFDVFYCSHVLEHVLSAGRTLTLARQLVRPGGWIVFLTPNGCKSRRQTESAAWSKSWGAAHPNLLDDAFYTAAADGRSILLASDPYDIEAIREWAASPKARTTIDNLSGAELLAVLVS